MSKLLKSKFFLGVMVVAFVLVGASVASASYMHTGLLKMGMSNSQVMSLQQTLNSGGFLVSTTGAGSPGMESMYFGAKTKAAVMAFQSAKGLSVDGVVGAQTGAALAAMTGGSVSYPAGCSSTSGFSTTTGQPCNSAGNLPAGCSSTSGFSSTTGASCSSGNGGSTGLSGGETSISNISVDDADDDTINEGSNKQPVADIKFDVDDADAQLVRADVAFQGVDSHSTQAKPWRVFSKVYLMSGSTVIASEDASDQDNWDDASDQTLDSNTTADVYRIRFNDINKVYKENSNDNELWVAVDVNDGVNGSDSDDAQWVVAVDTDGLRFTDSAGLDTEVDADTDTAKFSIQQAGSESGFNVTKDDSSPDASTLKVNSTSTTTQTVAVFKAKTDADGGDVKLDDFPVTLVTSHGATGYLSDVVSNVYIVVNGTTYTADANPSAVTSTQTFHFSDLEDDDVVINAGDSETVTVKVKFASQGASAGNYANGTTIYAAAALSSTDVEDADSGDNIPSGNFNGSSTGETMTLAGDGISVDVNSATTDITQIDGATNDTATFTWNVDVTAFGNDDVYINKDFADIVLSGGASSTDVDTIYAIDYSSGAALTSQGGTITTSSSADTVTGTAGDWSGETFYRIASGDTETFTITVSGTNQTDNKQVRAYLSNIEFTTKNAATYAGTSGDVQSYTANLAEDSQTPFKSIQ